MIDVNQITPTVVFAGLLGAIAWNLITWYFGLPSSSSHALFGAYAGAAIARPVSASLSLRLVQDIDLYRPGTRHRPVPWLLYESGYELDRILGPNKARKPSDGGRG